MIAIIDYGMGNIRSVEKAIQCVGGDTRMVRRPDELKDADKIVLPGVAAFGDAINELRSTGMADEVIRRVRQGTPYLGFCLGLQLLFEVGYEDGEYKGLGILPGKVVRFKFDQPEFQNLRIPHMGWNQVKFVKKCPMFEGIADGEFFYFAHSYCVAPADEGVICTTTDYGTPFVSSVWKDNVFATQFHPEKSQAAGLRVLQNFVNL